MLNESADRVRKHIDLLTSAVANDKVLMDLLQPEFDKFEHRTEPHNTYVVRMYIAHRNSHRKDTQLIVDLEWLLENSNDRET